MLFAGRYLLHEGEIHESPASEASGRDDDKDDDNGTGEKHSLQQFIASHRCVLHW